MSHNKFTKILFPGGAKGVGAWLVAGVIFGGWQYYEKQRDNTTNIQYKDFHDHNAKIKKQNPIVPADKNQ